LSGPGEKKTFFIYKGKKKQKTKKQKNKKRNPKNKKRNPKNEIQKTKNEIQKTKNEIHVFSLFFSLEQKKQKIFLKRITKKIS